MSKVPLDNARISVSMPEVWHREILKLAKSEHRPYSQVYQDAVRMWMTRERRKADAAWKRKR